MDPPLGDGAPKSGVEGGARPRAAGDELLAGMQRLEHLMEQVLERLERSERSTMALTLSSATEDKKPHGEPRAAVLQCLCAMQSEGLSLQAMANRLNNEGLPTLSGKGRWQKGTIGHLLAQEEG